MGVVQGYKAIMMYNILITRLLIYQAGMICIFEVLLSHLYSK